MDTTLKSWTLTLGTAAVAVLITTGHEQLVATAAGHLADVAWWIVRPLGPQ